MKKNPPISYRLIVFLLAVGVLLVFLINLGWGAVAVPPGEILQLVVGGGDSGNPVLATIVLKIRLPRVIAALTSGAALAAAGLLLQILFKNPVVDAFVLGISSGSGLAVGLVILAGVTFGFQCSLPWLTVGAAFVGALLVMLAVLALARRVPHSTALLVIGLIFAYLCSGVNGVLMTFSQKEQLQTFISWSMGSFSGFTWRQAVILNLAIGPALFGVFLLSKPLNALLLGEDYSRSLGVNLPRLRWMIILVTSVLTAVVTAFSGPVAFVGLAVPHLGRLGLRTSDNRQLIPVTLLLGALLTGGCDFIARTLFAPQELPLTAVTSLIGGPVVIYLVLRRRPGYS